MTAAHRVGRVATATLVAVLLIGVSAGPTTASETTVAKIDEFVERSLRDNRVPGAALAVPRRAAANRP